MENDNKGSPGYGDKKEITIIAATGVAVTLCVCCLLGVAGYFLYKDLGTPKPTPTSKPTQAVRSPLPTQSANSKVFFSDTFDSNANGWNEGTTKDDYGTITYTINGNYTWDVTANKAVNQKSWASRAPEVGDLVASVDATHVSGAENASYGIVFRVKDTNNLYYFCISDSGYYYVGLLKDGTWTTLIDWKEINTLNINGLNKLKVIGKGDEFTFFVNDKQVDQITDGSYPEGTAGLAIELYEAGDQSTFIFDNFNLTTP